METIQNVVLTIESYKASGRALLRGIAEYSVRYRRWAFSWEMGGLEKRWPTLQNPTAKGLILHDIEKVNVPPSYRVPTVVIGHLCGKIPNVVNVVTNCEVIGQMAAASGGMRLQTFRVLRIHDAIRRGDFMVSEPTQFVPTKAGENRCCYQCNKTSNKPSDLDDEQGEDHCMAACAQKTRRAFRLQ